MESEDVVFQSIANMVGSKRLPTIEWFACKCLKRCSRKKKLTSLDNIVLLASDTPCSPVGFNADPDIPFCNLPLQTTERVHTRGKNQFELIRDTLNRFDRPCWEADVVGELSNRRTG